MEGKARDAVLPGNAIDERLVDRIHEYQVTADEGPV